MSAADPPYRSQKPDPKTLSRLDRNAPFLQDDAFLKPVLEDDILLRPSSLRFLRTPLTPSAETDFDSLSLSPSAPAATATSSADADLIASLRAQLSDSTSSLLSLKKIVKDRLGASMGLDGAEEEVVVRKGKGKEGEERDDDSHYFESYAYNGARFGDWVRSEGRS